jgi:hypothetical protein
MSSVMLAGTGDEADDIIERAPALPSTMSNPAAPGLSKEHRCSDRMNADAS